MQNSLHLFHLTARNFEAYNIKRGVETSIKVYVVNV